MKSGNVAIVGRPNVGKSTLLNTILKQKVSITTPKPQTTRFNIQAVYEDNRGQILFVDTPGISEQTQKQLHRGVDVVVYMVDHTRERGDEDNKALGMVRGVKGSKILVINKIDVKKPSFIVQYKFLEDEFDRVVEISALDHKNINILLDTLFDLLPEGKGQIDTSNLVQPALNIDSKLFISEIIREKALLFLREEVPYTLTAVVDEVTARLSGVTYIKARILTKADRYKAMIIGKGGSMIKEIGQAVRKELETATDRKVYLDLTVETDPHWEQYLA